MRPEVWMSPEGKLYVAEIKPNCMMLERRYKYRCNMVSMLCASRKYLLANGYERLGFL